MIRWLRLAIGIGVVASLTLVATGATAGQDDRSDGAPGVLRERLTGYEEDPIGPGHDRYMGLRAADPPEEPPAARDGS